MAASAQDFLRTLAENQALIYQALQQRHGDGIAALMLAGKQSAWAVRGMERIADLHDVEFRVFSQNGEDGIIEWLVHWLQPEEQSFIEFGVENYTEANTRFLLRSRNWRGLIFDGSADNMQSVKLNQPHWQFDLQASAQFVTAETVNTLFVKHGFVGRIGLLSIDIDGNDYHVWQAISVVDPAIVVCEYNAVFGDLLPLTIPYQKNFSRSAAHHSNLYFGCSLPALRMLAEKKGYVFVGTGMAGANAFFVRKDLFPKIEKRLGRVTADPSLFRESRDNEGRFTYARGAKRLDLIRHLPVMDLRDGKTLPLNDVGPLYSEDWLFRMT